MREDGFTLVELLLVLGIFVILTVAATPRFTNVYNRYSIDARRQDLVHALRIAQNKTMNGADDDVYSVQITPGDGGSFTIFKGTDYAGRDTDFDEVHTLPDSINLSDTVSDNEINFAQNGETTDTGEITLTWGQGSVSYTIDINAAGRIDVN